MGRSLEGLDAGSKIGEFSDTFLDAVRGLVGEENSLFIKGYFPATASSILETAAFCLVYIDCDLYAPVKQSITWLDRKRSALLSENWTSASNNGVGELLGSGWGGSEPWGVWGIGQSHQLKLVFAPSVCSDVTIEADVQVPLLGSRVSQTVDIITGNELLGSWLFSADLNRGIRTVTVPLSPHANADGLRHVTLDFRPQNVASPAVLSSELKDSRLLGLGLLRIRRSGL